MRKLLSVALLVCLCAIFLAGCEVPTPPPELPTATPGSQNPESLLSRYALTPIIPTPERGFTPLVVPPGHIYFVRAQQLWRIEPDGSGERQLSNLPLNNPPQPSPDGSMLAFTSGKDLYLVPSSGGEVRKLASGEMTDHQRLGWSRDGKLVGYFTYDVTTQGSEKAWAVPAVGGEPLPITALTEAVSGRGPAYERTVQWSPDGKWVVVASVNNPMKLFRWPLASGQPGDETDVAGGEPDWCPDSGSILYSETVHGALMVYIPLAEAATPFRNEQQVVGTGFSDYAQGPSPRWSPASSGTEGDLIAYRSRAPQGEPRVSVRLRDGEELKPLSSFTNNPSWSPSGDHLVVETGTVTNDLLGLKWNPAGLAIARISLSAGDNVMKPLVKDAQWPAWGR